MKKPRPSREPSLAERTRAIARDPSLSRLSRLVLGFRNLNAEMPMQQAHVLLEIALSPGVSTNEIMAATGLVQSSASRTVHALSSVHRNGQPGLGLIDCRADPNDSRRLCYHLSEKGVNFVEAMSDMLGRWEDLPLPTAMHDDRVPYRLRSVRARGATP